MSGNIVRDLKDWEKDGATADRSIPKRVPRARFIQVVLVLLILHALAYRYWTKNTLETVEITPQVELADACPQTTAISPSTHSELLKDLEAQFANETFKERTYAALGGAVQIPTETYDDVKAPGQDSRWDIFDKFHGYLEQTFPLVHSTLKKTTVNTYALVYHWPGSDPSLKPILLTAHQDVVPVNPDTLEDWLVPPFSGHYDGKWIWGRGSCDDKPGLIGSLISVEELLKAGFKPKRSVVLAYGIDEERGGIIGGSGIRDYLLKTYGEYAFSILIDEGGAMEIRDDVAISMPAVAEKGHFDMRITVATPGGHSSVPPEHTSIGVLAALIVELEANPSVPSLRRNDTYYTTLQCQAAYDPNMERGLRKLIQESLISSSALSQLNAQLFKSDPLAKALGGTTQAVDIISGGIKANALPEEASALVNYRIAGHSSVADLQSHILKIISPISNKFNLSMDSFGKNASAAERSSASGHLVLSDAWGNTLEPAPVTPTTESSTYKFLSGTIINALKTSPRLVNSSIPIVVAPGTMTGNTDTRYYWKLTKNIFRYGHINRYDRYNGAHTVNEALYAEALIDLIRFFTLIILNGDETDLLE